MLDELVVTSSVVDGRTNVTLTFGAGGNLVQTRSNGGHSLVDGNYQLTIDHILISKVGGGPAMLEDFTFGDEAVDDFFRFYSDQDGDRDVDTSDLVPFGETFRLNNGDARFNTLFDHDGDNDVDTQDLVQFGQRFRESLPFS